jgi:uncharacterized paraquat-inducible protein A
MLGPKIRCAVCDASFETRGDHHLEDRLVCPVCGEPLKVVSQAPLRVDWAYEDLLEGPEYSVRSFFRRKFWG